MSSTSDYNLRPLWQSILDVYGEVTRICDKYGLQHQVAFGTALGAVRHNGFIPWDDDFDIMMPRNDYDRFLQIAETQLPKHLIKYTAGNPWSYWGHWCTIRDTRDEIVRNVERSSNLIIDQGIYIDVFPIDGMCASKTVFFLWRVKRALLRAGGFSYTKESASLSLGLMLRKYVLGRFARMIYPKCRSAEDFFWAVESFCKKIPFEKSTYAGYAYSAVLGELRQPRSLFEESVMMKFEDTEVPVPKNYDLYLKLTFGDWRKLPPLEQQVPGHQRLK